jgi:uncharacterized protein YkwD
MFSSAPSTRRSMLAAAPMQPPLRRPVALLFAIVIATALPVAGRTATGPDPAQVESGIVEQTNDFRRQQERDPLQVDSKLARAAADFAAFMARTGRYGHGAGGSTPAQRARDAGYSFCTIAENIAWQYNSAGFTTQALTAAFMKGWRNSPEHRRNMLRAGLTEIGVGVAHSSSGGRWYAVQLFGRPKSLRRSFSIQNAADRTVDYRLGQDRYTLPPRYTRTHYTCEPVTLHLSWPGQDGTSLEPKDGAELRIERADDGDLRLSGR